MERFMRHIGELTARTNSPSDEIKRVALVISRLRYGGAETVLSHLAQGLSARGVELRVICFLKGEVASELARRGIEIVQIASPCAYDLKAVFKLRAALSKFRPAVSHVHDYSSLPYLAVASLTQFRCPIVFTAHGLLYRGFENRQARLRFFSRRLSMIAAVSEQVRDRHVAYLNWRGPTRVVPNGVPDIVQSPADRHAVRHELGIAESAFVFLAIGNARPEKAFEDLIAAAAHLQARSGTSRTFSVLIAGQVADDDYGRQLRRISETSAVPGLRLLGYRSDVHRLYSAADAFVISSRSEGLPMVLLEAMTAGLPVIATRVGGIPSAVPPECGRLVDPERPEELARAMQSFLTADRATLQSIGSAARNWAVQEYGVDRMVRQYVELYADLVNPARGRSKR